MWLQHFAVWPLWISNAPSFGDATSLLMLVQTLQPKQLPETHSALTPNYRQPLSPVPGLWLLVTYQCQALHDMYWFMLVARARMTTRAAHRIDLCPPLPERGVESCCMLPLFQLFCNPPQGNHNWICHQFPCFCPLEDWFLQLLEWEVGIDGSSCLKAHYGPT